MRRHRLGALAALMLAAVIPFVSPPAAATPIVAPADLAPGDLYRLAFVTSTRMAPTSSSVEVYDQFVTDAASGVPELSSLGTRWRVIASIYRPWTLPLDARDHTDTLPSFAGGSVGVPIYLLDGIRLVDGYDDLWDGSILRPFNIDENGNTVPASVVATGSSPDGVAAPSHELSQTIVRSGRTTSIDHLWIVGSAITDDPHYYAISDVLQVPEPTPALLAAALLALLMLRRMAD